jgi:CheY-like chemotaxis protein
MMNLLIAEDSPKMRDMIKEMFRPFFENIFECEDGLSAVLKYKKYIPDWVFMDIKMKGMDGITATGEITKDFPGAKIIIVTGYKDTEFRKAAEKNGAAGYVLKDNLYEIYNIINL